MMVIISQRVILVSPSTLYILKTFVIFHSPQNYVNFHLELKLRGRPHCQRGCLKVKNKAWSLSESLSQLQVDNLLIYSSITVKLTPDRCWTQLTLCWKCKWEMEANRQHSGKKKMQHQLSGPDSRSVCVGGMWCLLALFLSFCHF